MAQGQSRRQIDPCNALCGGGAQAALVQSLVCKRKLCTLPSAYSKFDFVYALQKAEETEKGTIYLVFTLSFSPSGE